MESSILVPILSTLIVSGFALLTKIALSSKDKSDQGLSTDKWARQTYHTDKAIIDNLNNRLILIVHHNTILQHKISDLGSPLVPNPAKKELMRLTDAYLELVEQSYSK